MFSLDGLVRKGLQVQKYEKAYNFSSVVAALGNIKQTTAISFDPRFSLMKSSDFLACFIIEISSTAIVSLKPKIMLGPVKVPKSKG